MLVVFLADDSACLGIDGTCQEDDLTCSGSYVSGLCTGHAARRCCVPPGIFEAVRLSLLGFVLRVGQYMSTFMMYAELCYVFT